MTLQQLQTKANTKLQEFWDALIVKQEAYFLKHNKFFQLLVTDPVVDGVDTTWVLRTPSDEQHALDVDFSFNSPIPFSISVDEFVGDETGFSATAIVELPDARRFTRTRRAVPVVQEATYEPQNTPDDPLVELTPKQITDWTIETTAWAEIIEE